jgi:hypothetical protein
MTPVRGKGETMAIIQLSVFLENRLGRLNDVLSVLSKNGINIRALSLADKASYGILRLIVNDASAGIKALKDESVSVNSTPVIAAEVDDEPGGLLKILSIMLASGLNVEYMYAFVEKTGDKAVVVFRVEETEKAESLLKEKNITLLEEKELATF